MSTHCPFENGEVVYRSRGVVKTYIDTMRYDDSVICAPLGYTVKSTKPNKANPKKQDVLNGSLYPNPARDYLNIVFNQIPTSKLDIMVTDITGRVIYVESKKEISSNNYTIETKQWVNGVYLCRVYMDNKLILNTEVQIVK